VRGFRKWILVDSILKNCFKGEDIATLSVKLTQEEVTYLEEPYVPHRIVDHQ